MSISNQEVITAYVELESIEEASRFLKSLNDFEKDLQNQMNTELGFTNVDVEVTSLESSLAVSGNNITSSEPKDATAILTVILTGLIVIGLASSVACYYYWPKSKSKMETDIESEGRCVEETHSGTLKNHRFVIE